MYKQERRESVRFDFDRQVVLDFYTEVYDKCPIQNLSITGIFVAGSFQQKVGDYCVINLAQEGRTTYLTLSASAEVIRHSGEGIVLKFTSMSLESLMFLEMALLYEARKTSLNNDIQLPHNLPFEIFDEATEIQNEYNPFLEMP